MGGGVNGGRVCSVSSAVYLVEMRLVVEVVVRWSEAGDQSRAVRKAVLCVPRAIDRDPDLKASAPLDVRVLDV